MSRTEVDYASSSYIATSLPPPSLFRHVVDVHCHPTVSEIPESELNALPLRICAMASRHSDQSQVAELARSRPDKIIPGFGFHPWWSHWISLTPLPETAEAKEEHYRNLFLRDGSKDAHKPANVEAFDRLLSGLPHPFPLAEVLTILRGHLNKFLSAHRDSPNAQPKPMLGEVGLDRSFRVPFAAQLVAEPPELETTPAPEAGPRLSPFLVSIAHQQAILEAQLALAIELGVNVSLHSVQAASQTQEVLARMLREHGARFDAISVDMHSAGVSVATWKDIERRFPNVYLSQSTGINFRSEAHRELIAACAPDRLLVESDIHRIDQCAGRSWAILLRVAEVKGWHVEDDDWGDDDSDVAGHSEDWGAVRRLEANWRRFERAGWVRKEKRKARKRKDTPQNPDSPDEDNV